MEDGRSDEGIVGLLKPSLEAFNLMAFGVLWGKAIMISSNDCSDVYRSFNLPSSSSVQFIGLDIWGINYLLMEMTIVARGSSWLGRPLNDIHRPTATRRRAQIIRIADISPVDFPRSHPG